MSIYIQNRPSPVKGFTGEVQLTQERNLYQKVTVKQFTGEVNRPSLPSLHISPRGSLLSLLQRAMREVNPWVHQ